MLRKRKGDTYLDDWEADQPAAPKGAAEDILGSGFWYFHNNASMVAALMTLNNAQTLDIGGKWMSASSPAGILSPHLSDGVHRHVIPSQIRAGISTAGLLDGKTKRGKVFKPAGNDVRQLALFFNKGGTDYGA